MFWNKVPKGGSTPKELGLPFKEVRKVYSGTCGASGTKWDDTAGWVGPDNTDILAHAHTGNNDPWNKCICIQKYSWIFNSDRTPSDIMWHEYAHVLAKYTKKSYEAGKILLSETGTGNTNEYQDIFHGQEWKNAMYSLGKFPDRGCRYPY